MKNSAKNEENERKAVSGNPMEEEKKNIVLKGIGVSPGVVTGKAYLFDRLDSQVTFYKLEKVAMIAKEVRRLRVAVRASEEELRELKRRMGDTEVVKHLYIIDVHLMILRDRSFINHIIKQIQDMSVNAEWAVRVTIDKYREIFDKMEDEYLRERFSDVRYVGHMILRNLAGKNRKRSFLQKRRSLSSPPIFPRPIRRR